MADLLRSTTRLDLKPEWVLIALFLIAYPAVASDFFTFQIGAYALILGTIALSLTVLAGYGGMVSLAQLTVAGVAGYTLPIFGFNSIGVLGFEWPWWTVVPLAIVFAALVSGFIGAIAARTTGIYTIMITLAIAVSFFFFVRQNYAVFNGFTGYAGIKPPILFEINWRDPTPFYYLCLAIAAFFLLTVIYCSRSRFGLALQAVRDNPRRAAALGYNVFAVRVTAYVLVGIIAGTAGVLLTWFNGRISPGTISADSAIDILVIAVVGGIRFPIGAYAGALAFVLLENFAIDLIDRERFNTVIGVAFVTIILVSKDGIIGIGYRVFNFLTNRRNLRFKAEAQQLQDKPDTTPAANL